MSVPPHRRQVDSSETMSHALRMSAERVRAELQKEFPGARPEELNDLLDNLCTSILKMFEGRASVIDPRLDSELGRRSLERLREDVVQAWSRTDILPSARAIVDSLQVFNDVQDAVGARQPNDLAGRLARGDGSDLVVEMAHDLRSPLTSILSLAEFLHRGASGHLNDNQRRQLGLIYEAALHLSELANNVVEMARAGSGAADETPRPFSIAEVLDSVREIVQPISDRTDVAIRLVKPVDDYRMGQPQALSRVLLNLTANALKFTEKGFIEIAARMKHLSSVEFSVRDTGSGIPREALDTLYEPFRQPTADDRVDFSGTGLGLAICRRLVRAMGSELRVVTGAWGTQFSFKVDLPLASPMTARVQQSGWSLVARLATRAGVRATVAAAGILLVVAATSRWQGRPAAQAESSQLELVTLPPIPAQTGTLESEGPPVAVADPTDDSATGTEQDAADQTPEPAEQVAESSAVDPEPATGQLAAPVEPGLLFVSTTPWGELYVDDRLLGNTPKVNLAIAPGSHVIRVVRAGFEPYEQMIEVEPGQRLRLTDIVLRRLEP